MLCHFFFARQALFCRLRRTSRKNINNDGRQRKSTSGDVIINEASHKKMKIKKSSSSEFFLSHQTNLSKQFFFLLSTLHQNFLHNFFSAKNFDLNIWINIILKDVSVSNESKGSHHNKTIASFLWKL